MYIIYWLINENKNKTYIGFSSNLNKRLLKHKLGNVESTKNFGKFSCYIIEIVETLPKAKEREKYWKSHSGRKKLKTLWDKVIN